MNTYARIYPHLVPDELNESGIDQLFDYDGFQYIPYESVDKYGLRMSVDSTTEYTWIPWPESQNYLYLNGVRSRIHLLMPDDLVESSEYMVPVGTPTKAEYESMKNKKYR